MGGQEIVGRGTLGGKGWGNVREGARDVVKGVLGEVG
jgi:hypothetical protein